MQRLLRLIAGTPSGDPSRLMWAFSMVKACLWLAVGLGSALLVYWLHFKPAYEADWTATAGSVVCAGLSLYAAVACLGNIAEIFTGMSKLQGPLRR